MQDENQFKNKHMTLGIAEDRPNEADAAGIGILAAGISGCRLRNEGFHPTSVGQFTTYSGF